VALRWISRATDLLRDGDLLRDDGPGVDHNDALLRSALEINFGVDCPFRPPVVDVPRRIFPRPSARLDRALKRIPAKARSIQVPRRPQILTRMLWRSIVREILLRFEQAQTIIEESERYFKDVSAEEAERIFNTPHIPPAYAIFGQAVYFTPAFLQFGPMCRAAMVLHESIHVIDSESGTKEAHISEWDEPGFANQTAEESVHNPSAYASFGAQVYEGKIAWPPAVRYGAGRPND
jgi:hypothetical protein